MPPRWPARWLRALLAPVCPVCGDPAGHRFGCCVACADALPWLGPACSRCALPVPAPAGSLPVLCGHCLRRPPPLQASTAACLYQWPVDGLLRRFKFQHDLAAGRLLAALLAERCAAASRPQALVPVPLHRARLRQRGYDQALELARPLATQLGLACLPALVRTRATPAQSGLDAAARARNLHGAFVAMAGLPAHVALVDDVMTTGATLHAATLALRRAGVQRVDAWVCARVP
jgi:ComF family protein